MKTHGLKAFISSFSVSMFAIFVASNNFASPHQNKVAKIVPSKNIALFFKDAPSASGSPIGQVQKIALTTSVISNIAEVEPMQEETLAPQAEIAHIEDLPQSYDVPLVYVENKQEAEKIIQDYAEIIKKPAEVKIIKPVEPTQDLVYAPTLAKSTEGIEVAKAENAILIPITKNNKVIYGGDISISDSSTLEAKVAQASPSAFSSAITPTPTAVIEEKPKDTPPLWIKMSDTDETPILEDTTWSIAQGSAHPKNKMMQRQKAPNQEVLKEEGAQTKSAEKPLQNILIPLPDSFSKSAEEMPSFVEKTEEEIKTIESEIKEDATEAKEVIQTKMPEKTSILKNITSLFSKKSEDQTGNQELNPDNPQEVSDTKTIAPRARVAKNIKRIMPTEIRLAFAPNRVEVSGQTLSWLNSFAEKSKSDEIGLEIRVDGANSPLLQQKRLNMIYSILSAKNVDPQRVKTVFTGRDANSFIIKIVSLKTPEATIYDYTKYYQQQ